MDNRKQGKDEANSVDAINFALLIRKQRNPDNTISLFVRSENQGIPDAEIILIVEAWVEKVKQKAKDTYMGNFTFDGDLPKDNGSNDK